MIDKPQGWTSHDVVNKVRRIAGERSVGHLGTLDPMATGVLPLLMGSATRLARFYEAAEKVYEATIRFGFATNTYDAEGEPSGTAVDVVLDPERVTEALVAFTGVIQQMPPIFSAKKIRGVPAYKLAREHKPVELSPVEVEITALDLLEVRKDEIVVRVACSTGTYVRSLAHDLGTAIGCGAHLVALRRTKSGDFTIAEAYTLLALESLKEEGRFSEAVTPSAKLLPTFPEVVTDDLTTAHIRNGRDFHTSPFRVQSGSRFVKAISEGGALLAIGQAVLPNLYHPVVVIP